MIKILMIQLMFDLKKTTKVSLRYLLLSIILLNTLFSASVSAAPNTRSPLGINSNEVMDDDASIPFINVFKNSIPFEEARPWLTKGKVEYDKDGWPKKLNGGQAGTRFLYKLPKNTVPDGLYTVLYDGEGIMTYSDDAKLVHRESGKDVIKITAGKDNEFRVKLIIKHSNPDNYLRNIRVLLPGGICSNNPYKRVNSQKQCRRGKFMAFEKHHERLIFNPDYLNYMKDFKVIRFMNMSGITRNPTSLWSERAKVNDATWAGKQGVRGAPLEIMVALANKLNADPWFNLPHKATNNYMRQYALYLKNNLKPNLKAYIEYTNEAWNTIFTQAHYVKDMGERMNLDEDRDKGGYKYFSLRSVQMFDIFEQTFGGTQRLVRVMGSWTGWTRMSEMLLSYRDAYKKTDAMAVAPYFFPSYAASKKAKSVNQLFKLMYDPEERYSIPKVLGYIYKNALIAEKFGVDMIAYEGGQHLVDWKSRNTSSHPTALMIKANRDSRMAKAYKVFMRGWKDNGGKLFVNFSAPRTYQWFGSWGTKEYITQPDSKAPKHRALMQFSRQHPCWWRGCRSPQMARLKKPAVNPSAGVFALVKSKPRKNPKKTFADMVAKTDKKRTTIGTAAPKAPHKTTKTPAKTVVASAKPAPKKTATKKPVVASNKANTPVWGSITSTVNKQPTSVKRPARPVVVAKKSPSKASPKSASANNASAKTGNYDATVHRFNGRGRMWSNKNAMRLKNIVSGKINGGSDLSAVWQTHWDNKYLHVRVDAIDDKFIRDSRAPWSDDSIEIFIDADGSRGNKYDGKNDFHLIYRWKDRNVSLSQNSPRKGRLSIKQTMTRSDRGYTLETSIPWSTLGIKPKAGRAIGVDIQINDDDSGNGRDGKLAWHAKRDTSWKSPQTFGRLVLGI